MKDQEDGGPGRISFVSPEVEERHRLASTRRHRLDVFDVQFEDVPSPDLGPTIRF